MTIRLIIAMLCCIALAACGSDDPKQNEIEQGGPEALAKAPDGAKVTNADVTVEHGKPTGDLGSWKVTQGDYVEFHITSDVVEEVHVHGLDVLSEIEKGENTFALKATDSGVYEVELEESGAKIGDLSVYPK